MRQSLRMVGRGDLSVGQLYEGHVNTLLLFDWYATDEQLTWLCNALDRRAWLGIWATEPAPGTTLSDAKAQTLRGAKMFACGAGGLDYAIVTAAVDGTERRLAIAPANDVARADTSSWRVRGMRVSLSGRYALDGISVEPLVLLGAPGDYDREPRFTAGAWRFCAVQLGGIEALLTELRGAMGDVQTSDPIQRARCADAVVAARSAGFWVEQSAMQTADEDPDAVTVARLTRGAVERAGLDVMEAATRILGTRSAFDGEGTDKIIRDLSLYLRQASPDHARDHAALALLEKDCWPAGERLW